MVLLVTSVESGKAERNLFLGENEPSTKRLITIFYKIDVSRRGFYFCFSFKRDFVFDNIMKLLLTFSGAEKEAKRLYSLTFWRRKKQRHPPHPVLPLYWKAQHRKMQKQPFSFLLSKPGHGLYYLSAGA
jgi:hypothetical protein